MDVESVSSDIESKRILAEYQRRRKELGNSRYAPWQPSEMLFKFERQRTAARLLLLEKAFPHKDSKCLEIGCGSLGWLADLIAWGVYENNLHGIELDDLRSRQLQSRLPSANILTGNAASLPWADESFDLLIASTVFSSILDDTMRERVACEIRRVLKAGGALVWYDLRYNNPWNKNVAAISRRELRKLFPDLRSTMRSVSLAPPLARFIARWSWVTATAASALPFLRTHLLAVMVKRKGISRSEEIDSLSNRY